VTRDYKNVSESRAKKAAPKGGKKVAKTDKTLPPWLWMLSGLIIGGFVSFLVFLKVKIPESENIVVETAPKAVESSRQPENNRVPVEPEKEERFKFYEILPNREVNVPEPADSGVVTQEQTQAKQPMDAAANKTFQYVLQAGSFVRFQDADRRKANLAFIGLMSKIHAVESKGKTLYRVRIGPYSSSSQANEIEEILKQNNIPSLLMKVKG